MNASALASADAGARGGGGDGNVNVVIAIEEPVEDHDQVFRRDRGTASKRVGTRVRARVRLAGSTTSTTIRFIGTIMTKS